MRRPALARCACFLLLFASISGCNFINQLPSDGDGIVFETMQGSYEPGDEVEMRLENNSDELFRVGSFCELRLQKQTDDRAWRQVWKQESCYHNVIEVEPGEQAQYRATLPSDLSAGSYRYTLGRAESTAFTVRGA